eukprot:TRINITY_DN31969_c0_g1_i1.p1 TRINITY_DN31969_c0_g1~~TRINITY_DN31969_c0_g1_i1.p1  ORF type:complete len:210 (-),score=38.08 TRINITY_DN31969_c0_g1_i1:69-698(-)
MGKAGKPRKAAPKKGWLDGMVGNLFFFAIAGGIGYCRYHSIKIPILDDFIIKMRGGGGGPGAPVHSASSTLSDARAGKAIVLEDLLMQMNQYCGRRGACSEEYWEALPTVAAAIKMGPGTWDRKPLKKAKASEIDELLVKVARRPEAAKLETWKALRSISKELYDVTPKSMKLSLASKIEMESASPPTKSSAAKEEVEVEDETPVDDLS